MGTGKKNSLRNFTVTLSKEWSDALDREAKLRGLTRAAALVDPRWYRYLPSAPTQDRRSSWRGRPAPLAEALAAQAEALVALGVILRFQQDAADLRQEMRRLEQRILALPRRTASALADAKGTDEIVGHVSAELRGATELVNRLERLICTEAPRMPTEAQHAARRAQEAIATAVSLLAPRLSARVGAPQP